MPPVKVCMYCYKEMDEQKDKYLVVTRAHETTPEQVAHVACYEKQMRA